MIDFPQTEQYYSRGVARGDFKNATEAQPVRIVRYEFDARQFDAYLVAQGLYREEFVSEFPELAPTHTT